MSANVSYAQAADDVEYLIGVRVAAKTQQRIVQRQAFCPPARQQLKEVSVDGGKVRLRIALGEPCRWKDYKAVDTDEGVVVASYRDNATLTQWVSNRSQRL